MLWLGGPQAAGAILGISVALALAALTLLMLLAAVGLSALTA